MPAHHFLRRQANWEELYFYKKTVVLYQLTFAFTKRFLKVGDRTVDQMVQAARSGKQNIVEVLPMVSVPQKWKLSSLMLRAPASRN